MINIIYSTNEPFFRQMLISAYSIIENTKEPVNIINMTFEVPEYDPRRKKTSDIQNNFLRDLVKRYNKESDFKSVDVSDLFRKTLLKGPNVKTKLYSYFNTVRLVADLVECVPDKVIYLDADTIVNGDIKKFWDIDMNGYEVAGVKDWGRVSNYINGGVLLMDMKAIREHKSLERARDLVTKKHLIFLDMDAINKCCKCKVVSKVYADFKYNPNSVIHHMITTREGKIFLTKKWRHRIKPDEFELVRKNIPEYNAFYNELGVLMNNFDLYSKGMSY